MNNPKKTLKILVTAGPTRERLDCVRYITNFSTGNMGYELARESLKRGYNTTLISGPTNLSRPDGVRYIRVESALDMYKAVKERFRDIDCLFMASAVCDWRPYRKTNGKIKKGSGDIMLHLVQNPDILSYVGRIKGRRILVGFALERENLLKNARMKLAKKNLDLIVANKVCNKLSPFGKGKTRVVIIDKDGRLESFKEITKKRLAANLFDRVEGLWAEKQ